jgi:hypothetical protein
VLLSAPCGAVNVHFRDPCISNSKPVTHPQRKPSDAARTFAELLFDRVTTSAARRERGTSERVADGAIALSGSPRPESIRTGIRQYPIADAHTNLVMRRPLPPSRTASDQNDSARAPSRIAPVSEPVWGTGGSEFKSRRSDQIRATKWVITAD